jgi:hypothetical protein
MSSGPTEPPPVRATTPPGFHIGDFEAVPELLARWKSAPAVRADFFFIKIEPAKPARSGAEKFFDLIGRLFALAGAQ